MRETIFDVNDYFVKFYELFMKIDRQALAQAAEIIRTAWAEDRQIFTAGNGGSAAIAVHFAADFGKNVTGGQDLPFSRYPRITSLCCNTSTLTAIANDCGYENVFAYQLRNYINSGDVVVLISSSGNSPNVIRAAEYAHQVNAKVITMTGFSGGKLKPLADCALHIDSDVYELVEDVHSFFTHAIVTACKVPPQEITELSSEKAEAAVKHMDKSDGKPEKKASKKTVKKPAE